MNDDRHAKRTAYITAQTYERAYYERYYPVPVPGGRPAEAVTPEVLQEIARLKAVSNAAKLAWETHTPD